MNNFTKISKIICIISLICCCMLTIILAVNLSIEKDMSSQISDWVQHDDYYERSRENFNAGKFFLILFGGMLITAIVHSLWGMFISMAEDIHTILYLTDNEKVDTDPGVPPKSPYDILAAKVEQTKLTDVSSSNALWYCRNCGEKNPGDAKQCRNCGLYK